MKTIKRLLAAAAFILFFITLPAQTNPPTPNEGDDPTTSGNNTPVGGLFILLALGAAYGGKMIYKLCRKDNE